MPDAANRRLVWAVLTPTEVVRSSALSIVVIGLNHRTVPLELLERTTRDGRRAAQGAARPRRRGRNISEAVRALDVQPHRGLRRRRALPPAPTPTSATSCASSPAWRPRSCSRPPLQPARRGRRRPPVLGGRRARVGRARRARDPRAGARRLVGGASTRAPPGRRSTSCSATRSRPASGPAPRPASAAVARRRSPTPPSRWPPSASARSPERRVLVVGAGEMGEGIVAALAGTGVGEVVVVQPHLRSAPSSWPSGSAAGPCRSRRWPTRWPRPTCC